MIFGLERRPSRDPALLDDRANEWLGYGELASRVAAIADGLRRAPRSVCFLFGANDLPSVVAYLACLEAAVPVALLRPELPAPRRQTLLDCFRPGLVFAAEAPLGYRPLVFRDLPLAAWQRERDAAPVHPELSLLLSTSGSTGSAKLVRLSQAAVASNADAIAQALAITAATRAMLYLPMSYSFGLSVLDSHLAAGGSVVLTEQSFLSRELWSRMNDQRVTSFPGVPYVYQSLARLGFDDLAPASLDTLTQAGGKLSDALIARFHAGMAARNGRFFAMYGQTEATARISVLPSEWLPAKLGSVGRTIPGGTLSIAQGAHDRPGSGEIFYRGPNVMLGYALEAADLRRGDDLAGELATGDLGTLDPDGCLYITGRAKHIAKIAGVRLNLDEVEALAARFAPAAALERDDVLSIVLESNDAALAERARRELAAELGLSPASLRVRAIDRLPTGEHGKLDREALRGLR